MGQVSKLERVLKEEKAARERQVAELEAYAAQLEDELELEHRRRLNEQLCALIEGAPFIMYKSHEVSERHVWFRCHHTRTWCCYTASSTFVLNRRCLELLTLCCQAYLRVPFLKGTQ